MTIIGRITKDAVVNTVKDERKVVNFSVAINESYKPKNGERVDVVTYCNCSYWIREKVAEYLTKGKLVELTGRIYANAYTTKDGEAKASLNCHVSNIKFLAKASKEVATKTEVAAAPVTAATDDDLPF